MNKYKVLKTLFSIVYIVCFISAIANYYFGNLLELIYTSFLTLFAYISYLNIKEVQK